MNRMFKLKRISKGEIFACDWIEFVVENDNRLQCFDFARFCGLYENEKVDIHFGVNIGLACYTLASFKKLVRKGDCDIFRLSDIVEGIEPEKNKSLEWITTLRIKKNPYRQPHKHKVGDRVDYDGVEAYIDSLSHAAFSGKAMYNLTDIYDSECGCSATEERLFNDKDYLYGILDDLTSKHKEVIGM